MLFQIPREHADPAKVDVRIGSGFAFSNDIPVDLAGEGVLHPVDCLDSGIDVALAVLSNIGGISKLTSPLKIHPTSVGEGRTLIHASYEVSELGRGVVT